MLVAGMIVGTLFTLFVVPAFYSIIAATHRPLEEVDEEVAAGALVPGAG